MLTRMVAAFAALVALGLVFSAAPGEALASKTPPPAEAAEPASPPAADAHHKGGEESGAEGLNPITFKHKKMNFPGDTSVWTAVVFLVVLAILWKFAWKPIAQGLEKRERQIADQIAQAHQSNEDARRLLEEYQQRLAASQDEVRGIIAEGRREAEQVGRQMLDKARGEAEAERQRALQQIDTATAAALKELADRSASLAVELAGKIVRTRLRPQDHAELIQEAVAGFVGQGPGNGKK